MVCIFKETLDIKEVLKIKLGKIWQTFKNVYTKQYIENLAIK